MPGASPRGAALDPVGRRVYAVSADSVGETSSHVHTLEAALGDVLEACRRCDRLRRGWRGVRAEQAWRPSKMVRDRRGAWSPNPHYVRPESRFACQVLSGPYAALITAHASGRLLDAGCGDVPYYGIYRPLVDEVVCIDWPGSSHGRQHVDAWVDLNAPLPFGDGGFDTVLLADVLEHIARPEALLAELARALAPGGRLLVMVPFLYWVHEAPHDYHRYTEFALRRLCALNGLRVTSLEPYGGHPDVIVDLLSKALVRGRHMGGLYDAVFSRLTRTGPYRWMRRRGGRAFPLGYTLCAEKRP